MTRKTVAFAFLLLVGACARAPESPGVTQAWVRLPAVAGQPAAAYFTVTGGRGDEMLVQVVSAVATRIDLHDSMKGAHGIATMRPLAQIPVPAGAAIRFSPGGRHAMLYGLDPAIAPGTAVPLRFGFASGKAVEAEAKTVAAGEDAPY